MTFEKTGHAGQFPIRTRVGPFNGNTPITQKSKFGNGFKFAPQFPGSRAVLTEMVLESVSEPCMVHVIPSRASSTGNRAPNEARQNRTKLTDPTEDKVQASLSGKIFFEGAANDKRIHGRRHTEDTILATTKLDQHPLVVLADISNP